MSIAGVDLFLIARLLGHSVQKTTELYAHLHPNYLRGAVSVLSAATPKMRLYESAEQQAKNACRQEKKKSVGSKINELLPMKLPTEMNVLLPRGRNPLKELERATRIELATPTLAKRRIAEVKRLNHALL